ncbi:MAG: glycosyltransferase [Prevotella sp.]|nr:glycosyltransferase [Prevotella sp.]
MNDLLYMLLKKSSLNKLVYKIRRRKCHELITIDAETVSHANELLHSIYDNPQNSCIAENHISDSPRYDLQIIVPAYNVEKYIKECLDSVLMQQTSFSYIVKVINDGSTDETGLILEQYKHISQIQIIHQRNKGFSGARNTGLEHIDARYVMFLDSDDKLMPGAIQKLMEAAQETRADIVEGSSIKFLGPIVTKKFHHTDEKQASTDRLFGFAWGKVYKSAMFAHIKFPEGYWFEDTVCSFVLHPMAKSVSTISHCIYGYRTNLKGISRSYRGKPKVLDSLYVCEQLLKDMKRLNVLTDENWAERIARQFKLNAKRIASLKREDADKALFTVQCHLFREMFTNKKPSALAQALLDGDYKAFKLQTTWL